VTIVISLHQPIYGLFERDCSGIDRKESFDVSMPSNA